jgi:hypothetical protein
MTPTGFSPGVAANMGSLSIPDDHDSLDAAILDEPLRQQIGHLLPHQDRPYWLPRAMK